MNHLTDRIISNTEDRVKDSIWFVFNELHAACCAYTKYTIEIGQFLFCPCVMNKARTGQGL